MATPIQTTTNMNPKYIHRGSELSETNESTDLDLSFKTSSSRSDFGDGVFPVPRKVPLKSHHFTIGSTESKEIYSLVRRRDGSKNDEDDCCSPSQRFSDQRVSEIFFRDQCTSLYSSSNTSDPKKSSFVDDLQALFDTRELQAETFDDKEEDGASNAASKSLGIVKICTFGGVEIREYPIIPGDSPAGFKGPPLTIGWTPISTVRIATLDKYECVRKGHCRTMKQLAMPSEQRMEILKNQGFSRAEIQKCIKKANIARRQRKDSNSTLKHQGILERLESIQRKALNILTLGQRKKAQKEYLKQYVPCYGVAPTVVPAQ